MIAEFSLSLIKDILLVLFLLGLAILAVVVNAKPTKD